MYHPHLSYYWKLFFRILKWRYILYFLHAWLLLFVSLLLQESYFLYKDEEAIIQLGTIIKRTVVGYEKPDPERFLFINTSYDNTLTTVFDETGIIPLGNRPITDRAQLTTLFSFIEENPNYEFMMCDIYFEHPTTFDEVLAFEIRKLPNFYASSLMLEGDSVSKPVLDIPTSLTIVEVFGDIFTKFKLAHGKDKFAMPLQHYLEQNQGEYNYNNLFPKLNKNYILDPFFLNLRITNYDLLVQKSYPLINLGDLILLGEDAISDLTKDRIIVIGDFIHNDNVETYIGNISGPLILTNAYLALEHRDMIIRPIFLIFLFVCFYLVNFIVFSPSDYLDRKIARMRVAAVFKNLIKGFIVLFLFYLTSVLSFILFNIHINILLISLYLGLLDYIVRSRAKSRKTIDS